MTTIATATNSTTITLIDVHAVDTQSSAAKQMSQNWAICHMAIGNGFLSLSRQECGSELNESNERHLDIDENKSTMKTFFFYPKTLEH